MSQFNTTQKAALKSAILADAAGVAAIASGDNVNIMNWFNGPSTFIVNKNTTEISSILDNITWANFTPANPAAGAGQDFANWAIQCALKRDNVWAILNSSQGTISSNKANIRAGLQDALTGIPSGVAGATRAGGWPAVQAIMQRPATMAEKVFATGTGTSGNNAGTLIFDGLVGIDDAAYIIT